MKVSLSEKLAPLTGVVSFVLFFVAAGLYGFYEYHPAAEKLQSFFNEHATSLYYSGYLGVLSAIFLMWFAGSMYKTLRQNEGGEELLALIAFGGGFASGISIALAYSAIVIIAGLAGGESGIGPIEAVLLNMLYSNIIVVAGFPMAVLIGATSLVSLRTSMFPKWFSWISVVITIGLLTPEGWIILAPAMIWLFGVSIRLYRQGTATE
jgi:hypothetical protein